MADVVDTMIEGKVVQHALTVPEGLTSEQVVARLLETEALAGPIKRDPARGHAVCPTPTSSPAA